MKSSFIIPLAIVLCTYVHSARADGVGAGIDADTNTNTNAGTGTGTGTGTDAEKKPNPFAGDVPAYVEQAIAAGIDHRYTGPWEYFVGGGVATFDCNGDRLPELYIAGGADKARLYLNQSKPGGALKFAPLQQASTDIKKVLGSYPVDLDNDGLLDLVVLRLGENVLLKGGPDCRFTKVNSSFGFDGGHAWTTAFSASFNDNAAFPILAFGNYVDRTAPGSPWGTCEDNRLVMHTDEGEVDRASTANTQPNFAQSLPLSPGHCSLSMIFTDWNKSGRDDLRITNDRHYYREGQEQLWHVGGRYPRQYTSAEGWERLVIWGMGIAEADLDADGFPEYALTSMGDTKLQTLNTVEASEENRPAFTDVAWDRGATAHRPYVGADLKPSTGWHASFRDVNNDARQDLFIAKGNVERMSDFAAFDPDNLLLATHDGKFEETGALAGLALDTRGRGASISDLNADGLLDIVVINRDAPVSVFRHQGMHSEFGPRVGGNWLKVELRQPDENRFAVGARLSLKTGNHVQTRRVQIGGGHASGELGFVHFGLGVAERATLRVQWPDGEWSAPYQLFANHHVVVSRDKDHVLHWFPGVE